MPTKIKNATKRFMKVIIITFISNFLIGFNVAFVEYIKSGEINKLILVSTVIIAPIISGAIAALDKWLRWEEDEKYCTEYISKAWLDKAKKESDLHGDLK